MPVPLAATSGGDGGDDDRRRAALFAERARAVASTGNHEYAIEMYLQAIAITPQDVRIHQELRELSLRRKAEGGKDLGFLEKAKLSKRSRDASQNLVNAEKLLAYDPGNSDLIFGMLHAATKAELDDVAAWLRAIIRRASE